MAYVDGFVIPVPKANLDRYLELAAHAGAIWKEHGALEYRECVGDDIAGGPGMPPFGSRAHRDEVNGKVMADPRIQFDNMPFDTSRMLFGGFEVRVDAMSADTADTGAKAGAD
jgi:uncharacterized protein YbaA (DUF1428 family)